jgi:hypothetical protein
MKMSITMARLKSAGRVTLLAVALGATTFATAPAQAATFVQTAQSGGPQSSFSLQVPGGGDNQTMQGQQNRGFAPGEPHPGGNFWCLTDRQIRRGLADYGFRDVRVGRPVGFNRVEVRAVYGRWLYSMRVDRCSGRVDRVNRLRPAFGAGFGLHFEF